MLAGVVPGGVGGGLWVVCRGLGFSERVFVEVGLSFVDGRLVLLAVVRV